MVNPIQQEDHHTRILAVGLEQDAVKKWLDKVEAIDLAVKTDDQDLETDARIAGALIKQGWSFCNMLPLKSKRDPAELAAGNSLVQLITSIGREFCRLHRKAIYRKLTGDYSRFLRVDELAWKAAELLPGIMPAKKEVEQDQERMQKDKDGLEILQGIFFSQMLSEPKSGIHLLHAMLRPKPESIDLLQTFLREGVLELDNAGIEVKNGAGYIELTNNRFLNAEDETTVVDQETAVDLVLLHPDIHIGVLRGGRVDHPRYKGRRVFNSGINLTRIYYGKLPYLFYLIRDFGMVNKIFYGLAGDIWEEDEPENTLEKLWLAAVESFAIGGGCQLLLVMDYVIAEAGSYFNLPARKEGIIPGAANLRLSRFLGERMARQAIMFDKTFYVESQEASGLINEVVPSEQMDEAIQRNIDNALGSGMVSAAGNRKALRVQQETLEIYRRYMTSYAEIQAQCHFSSQLTHNLEIYWKAKEKKL